MPTQDNRKGQSVHMDKRPREKKQQELKQSKKGFWSNLSWKSQARKINEEKLAHYIETGNERKANIYRLKLSI